MEYNLSNVFEDLSIKETELSEFDKKNLLDHGYTVIQFSNEDWKKKDIDLDLISNVVDDLIAKEGWKGGWEAHDHSKHKLKEGDHPEPGAQRLNHLLNKHECFRKIISIPEILCATKLLMENEFRLSQLILRMPFPGKGDQPWHIDWMPRRKKSDPIRSVLSSLLLDDFTKENGTTRVVPGSHKLLKSPAEDGYTFQDHPNQKYIEAPRGSLLIYDINLWHRGSQNLNGKKRRHLNVNYRDVSIWQQINFKKELSENVRQKLSQAELYLLKARKEDKPRNDWLFQNRNNFFIKELVRFYLRFR